MDLSTTNNNNNNDCRNKQVRIITIRSLSGIIVIAFMLISSINMPFFTTRIVLATIATNDSSTTTTDVQRIEDLLEIVKCNASFRSNVDLSGCDLFGASFEEADLTNADLTNATLTGTNLLGAVMTNCIGCPQ